MPLNLCENAEPPQKSYNYEDYVANRLKMFYVTTKRTRESIRKAQGEWEKHYKSQKSKVKVGSQVYIKRMVPEGPNEKVAPKFEGPYRVLEILKTNKYKVIHETNCSERIAHHNFVKVVNLGDESHWKKTVLEEKDENKKESEKSDESDKSEVEKSRYNLRSKGRQEMCIVNVGEDKKSEESSKKNENESSKSKRGLCSSCIESLTSATTNYEPILCCNPFS